SFTARVANLGSAPRIVQRRTDDLRAVFDITISQDLPTNVEDKRQLRIVLSKVKSPGHGHFEIPSLEAQQILREAYSATTQVDATPSVDAVHVLVADSTILPSLTNTDDIDGVAAQPCHKPRAPTVAGADERNIILVRTVKR